MKQIFILILLFVFSTSYGQARGSGQGVVPRNWEQEDSVRFSGDGKFCCILNPTLVPKRVGYGNLSFGCIN